MTESVTCMPHSAEIDDVRLHVFVAQSLAVRPRTAAHFDDVEATIGYVRDALDEIEVLLPSLDEALARELRQGCARLTEAVDIVAGSSDGSLPRPVRRRLTELNAAGLEHMARALDRLGDSGIISAHTTLELLHSCSDIHGG